ncbi:MAG: hypothetical protein ACPG1Z_05060 [Planctomycetota bacterium]
MNDSQIDRWTLHRQASPGALQLDATDLEDLLPITREKLLIDRVLALRPGMHAIAEKAVSAGPREQQFRGRDDFSFPSTLAFSALEQLSLLIMISELPVGETVEVPALVSISSLEISAELVEPGLLHLNARSIGKIEVSETGDEVLGFEGTVSVNGEDFVTAAWQMKKGKP